MASSDDRIQIKVAFDRNFAKTVLPRLKSLYNVRTYSALFQLGLSMLALHADIHHREHDLVEVNQEGKIVGIVRIPELAIAKLQNAEHS